MIAHMNIEYVYVTYDFSACMSVGIVYTHIYIEVFHYNQIVMPYV